MVVVPSASPTWQPFAQAGYASDNSLYVPAEPVGPADTNDLVIGNFDLSSLAQATIRFKVTTSYYPTSSWSTVQLLFRDQCSNIFIGSIWYTIGLDEFATDQGMNYVPSADAQWATIGTTHPEWNLATSAEIVLRLIHPAYAPTFTGEAFYIDDLYVGELPVMTGIGDASVHPGFTVAPNPTHGPITVWVPHTLPPDTQVRLTDALGRVVAQQRAIAGTNTVLADPAPGLYLVTIGLESLRVVVE